MEVMSENHGKELLCLSILFSVYVDGDGCGK